MPAVLWSTRRYHHDNRTRGCGDNGIREDYHATHIRDYYRRLQKVVQRAFSTMVNEMQVVEPMRRMPAVLWSSRRYHNGTCYCCSVQKVVQRAFSAMVNEMQVVEPM